MTIQEIVREASFAEVALSADECLKCNVCNTVCPVARVTDLFPGPKYVGPQAQRFRVATLLPPQGHLTPILASPDATVDYCSGCGMCTTACPADVKIAEMNSRARAEMRAGHRPRFRDWLLGQTDLVGRLGVAFAPLANWTLRNRLIRTLIEWTIGIHRRAPLPVFARRTLRSRLPRPATADPPPDRAVVLFHGCAANYYEPDTGRMAVEVLEHNAVQVIVPRQGCCGLPLQSNGIFPAGRRYVRALARRLAPFARRGHDIVATSTSCALMLKREAREIMGVEDEDLALVGERVQDICEYLLALHDLGELRTDFSPLPLTVPYHAPCQQRGHGIGKPALDLFALIPELRVVEVEAECCGVAGTYGVKREKYDISMRVGEPIFRQVREAGADVTACDSETCRWHIAEATGVPAVHPVELLHRAYGLST
jgi:glycerol-3-phosphate dehydrogenase subunit C